MRVVLCTLLLNEMEWLPRLVAQHFAWPDAVAWIFVEGADATYAQASPGMVNEHGLSVDGTTEFMANLSRHIGDFVRHIPIGVFDGGGDVLHAKAEARNHYLRAADELEPDWLIVIDGDEFYSRDDQRKVMALLGQFATEPRPPVLFRQRYPWFPPYYQGSGKSLFRQEVTGSYFSVPHLRVWPWYPGLRYATNHNWPEFADGTSLRDRMVRMDRNPGAPQCVHMAFASKIQSRQAKHAYYVARGEAQDPRRKKYVECRAAWEGWRPGRSLPRGAVISPYDGPIPEMLGVK